MVCEALDQCLNGSKIPEVLKQEAQDISCVVQTIVEEEDKLYKEELKEVVSKVNNVSVFGNVCPGRYEGGAAERSNPRTSL